MRPIRVYTAVHASATLKRAGVATTGRFGQPTFLALAQSASTAATVDPGLKLRRNCPTMVEQNRRARQLSGHLSYSTTSTSTTTTMSRASPKYTVRKVGAPHTLEHRIYIEQDGVPVSPFHDIPLYANEQQTVLNMIVEIPRWTNAKQEVCYSIQASYAGGDRQWLSLPVEWALQAVLCHCRRSLI